MHIESISNGFGAPSMYMMIMAGMREIPATVSISADTGWENDCLLSNGQRVTSRQFYDQVVEPLGAEFGIETAFVRVRDKNGNDLPPLGERLRGGNVSGVPLFGSNGGRLSQGCTGKFKVRAIRQELRRMGATTARSALGLTMDECHRMKKTIDVNWHSVYWPLIDGRMYKAGIINKLNGLGVPYMLSSQCDGCPHQNLSRWDRLAPETIDSIAAIEEGLGGGLFFTDRRIPLKMAITQMRGEQPDKTLFDACDSGYCFT